MGEVVSLGAGGGIESVWASTGPDYSDPLEVTAYTDWLLDSGKEPEAAAMRWAERFGRMPLVEVMVSPRTDMEILIWGWRYDDRISVRRENPETLPFLLWWFGQNRKPRRGEYTTRPTQHDAYLAIQGAVKRAATLSGLNRVIEVHLQKP